MALATVLWLTVAGEHLVERGLRVPLEFRNIPQSLEIVGTTPDTVDVRLRGSSAVLRRLQAGDIVAVLNMANTRAGSRIFSIRPEDVRAPFGVEVAQVYPPTLELDLERSAQRNVPVVPKTDGDPSPGFVVGRMSAEPSTVSIVGPESRVQQIAEAHTEPINVAGARTRVRDVVNIGVSDASVRLADAQTATVIVEVWPAPVEKQLSNVPVRWRNLGAGLRAQLVPGTIRVTVRGAKDPLAGVRSDSIQSFVDLAGLGPGRYNLRVQMDPAESFGVTSIEPAVVSVTIR